MIILSKFITLTAVVALCMIVGACGSESPPSGPDYTPIPDKELFAQIANISGVTEVDLSYRDTFESGSDYVGTIKIDSDADPAVVLDHALAILRQGRWQASMTVVALQGKSQTATDVLGLKSPGEPFLTERYGPQPGDGKPPVSTPTPS